MKTMITTTLTFLTALLTIGLIGINNNINNSNSIGTVFAQMDPEDPSMAEDMEMDDEGMMMSNQSEGMKMTNLNGTIDVETTIAEAFKSKITTNITEAIQAAQTNVGANSFVKEAELTPAHGYLVYKITVVDENMKKYQVIVDPGTGEVLMKKEITWCDYDHEKMKYGGEKYDKYSGHGNEYDKKKMMTMMMKDKEY
jgi:peptidase YpeB-like protein